MLLSELRGAQVVTTEGEELGRVHDVVLVQDGPMGANGRAGLRLHAIAVGSRSVGSQLGYAQGTVEGPWLVRRLLRRPPRLVPWSAIVQRDEHRIVVDPSLDAPDQ
ncbi:MAG TPA: PRC-barrel domain-containing protein, partial [Acidimicrobiia bacterium]